MWRPFPAVLVLLLAWSAGSFNAEAADGRRYWVPLDERLQYRVSWLGVHCGDMTLESARVEGSPALVRMLMTVRTTEFFDSVYRVRAEIESIYNVRRGSTRSFHEVSSEKGDSKDDLWTVDLRFAKAHRTLDGTRKSFDVPADGGHDPLAMLYRLRAMAVEPDQELSVTVITANGVVEASARVEGWERFETPAGEITALKVVQQAVGSGEFARGGGMTMWLSEDPSRTPLRIDFELPFGHLVADLLPEVSEGEGLR